nr:exonuclease domain-containing protein [uncultured Pseudogulbenkiania sp.]
MLFQQPCAIVDLETTGGHITRDRITEIGILLIDGERIERYETLVNPGQPIPPFIENMTGISDAMVAEAPPFAALVETLLEKLQGRLLLAHNARFDYGFLKNEFKRAGHVFQSEVLCTVKLSRRLYPQHFKHSLDSLIARHGIVLADRHRAMADALAVYHFIEAATAELGPEAVQEAATALLAPTALPPGLDPELLDSLPDVPGVYLLLGDDGLPLYVGRGANLRRQVLAHFYADKAHGKTLHIAEPIRGVEWRETLGEFGAMLLELQWIRAHRPRHNRRGGPGDELCSIQLGEGEDGFVRPRIVLAHELDFSRTADLYGLFRHPREARKMLQDMARAQGLCQAVLGVEQMTSRKGAPCGGFQAGLCRGACIGREPAMQHNTRLMSALSRVRVKNWPFPGAVAVVEWDEVTGERVEHVFDRWCYLGTRHAASETLEGQPSFDLDSYKLFSAYLKKPTPSSELRLLDEGEMVFSGVIG